MLYIIVFIRKGDVVSVMCPYIFWGIIFL